MFEVLSSSRWSSNRPKAALYSMEQSRIRRISIVRFYTRTLCATNSNDELRVLRFGQRATCTHGVCWVLDHSTRHM